MFSYVITNSNITPDYFWKDLSVEELNSIINDVNNIYKTGWEQTRWIGYINALLAGNKFKNPKEFWELPWEQEEIQKEIEDPEVVKQRLLNMIM